MRITLNLATRPYADQGPALKQLRIGMGVLALVLILLGLGLMHFHQAALRMAAQEAAVDRSIAAIEHEQTGYQAQMSLAPNARVLTQAQFLNQLFDEKSFSWTAAMEDLEPVLPAGVQVTAIEPVRDKNGELTLRLRITGPREKAVTMVRNMEHSKRFVSPRIAGENAENTTGQGELQPVSSNGKVSFEVLAEYSQATLAERKVALESQKRKSNAVAPAALPAPRLPMRALPAAPAVAPATAPQGPPPPGMMRGHGHGAVPHGMPGNQVPPQGQGGPQ
jgi:type IV pilus assembly protein PilN